MENKEKCRLCLASAEKAKEMIKNEEARSLVESAIRLCRSWLDNKCDIAEELYHYLDNEENGFTIFQELETDKEIISAWNIIIDAVAYVCKSAYLETGADYFPEPIESVDDTTVDYMIGCE